MSGWETVSLGDICSPKQHPTIKQSDLIASGYPVYGANGHIGFAATATHTSPVILIGCRGTIGSIHVTDGPAYATGNAMALNNLDEQRVNIGYLAKYLSWRGFKDLTTGSSQPQLTRSSLLPMKLPLPPRISQDRISSILDEADDIRTKHWAQLAQLDELPQSILHEALHSSKTSVPLADIASFVRGVTYKPSDVTTSGIGIMRTKNVQKRLELTDIVRITPKKPIKEEKFLREGDTLVSSANSWNLVGKCCYVEGLTEAMAIGGFVTALRPNNRVNPRFLYHWFSSAEIQQKVRNFGKQTTNISNLDIKRTAKLPVPLPPLQVQKAFAAQVEAIHAERVRVAYAIEAVNELFAVLQHRAFHGEL